MRGAVAFALAISASVAVLGQALAQRAPTTGSASAAAPAAAPAPAQVPALIPAQQTPAPKCANPNALGVSRTVEIDTTGGPGFGFEHFKAYDFLRDHEIVLTFDDGPWPGNTPAGLRALARQCTKAVVFNIGKHAGWDSGNLKQGAPAGP